MNNNLVNEYYEKLFLYSSEYKTHKYIKKNKELLSFALNNIIDSHNDYLLSESIINYLSSLDSIIKDLRMLAFNSNLKIIDFLTNYYRSILFYLLNNETCTYIELLDNDTKLAVIHANNLIRNINNDLYCNEKILLKKLVYVILCYCHIYNKMNEYINLCNKYINNSVIIIDDLDLNGIERLDNIFINRTLSILENKNKIMIK